MASFYESLKDLFSSEMTTKIAEVLKEKDTTISKTSSHIIAGLLGLVAKKGHTSHLKQIFEEAGNKNLLSDIGMFDEHLTHPEQEIGDNFLEHILGDKAETFTTAISKETGVSHIVVNKLTSVIAPILPAFFGKKMVKDGMNIQSIIGEIKSQEKSFSSKIPADLVKAFGLGTFLNAAKPQPTTHVASGTTTQSTASTTTSTPEPEPKKNKNSWITWLFALIGLLLIFFWWRSCNSNPDNLSHTGNEFMVDSVSVNAEAPENDTQKDGDTSLQFVK